MVCATIISPKLKSNIFKHVMLIWYELINQEDLDAVTSPSPDYSNDARVCHAKWKCNISGDSKWPCYRPVGGHITFRKGHLTIPKRSQRIAGSTCFCKMELSCPMMMWSAVWQNLSEKSYLIRKFILYSLNMFRKCGSIEASLWPKVRLKRNKTTNFLLIVGNLNSTYLIISLLQALSTIIFPCKQQTIRNRLSDKGLEFTQSTT